MFKWINETLGEGIEVKHGFAFKGEFFTTEGSKILITPGNFYEQGGFKYTPGKEKFYIGDIPEEYLCSKGDLVVAMTEQAAGLLGSTALVPEENIWLHNQRIGLVTYDELKYDKLFLLYLFQTKWVRKQIALSASGTKVKHTSPKRIYDVKIQRPPLSVQREIGQLLFDLDTKIALNNKLSRNLERMATLIYDYWFVQFDFPDEKGKPYKSSGGKMVYNEELKREIPKNWEDGVLSDVADITMGQSPSGSSYNEEGIGTVFYQGSTDFGSRFPTVRKYTTQPSRMAEEGDILLSVRAPVGTMNQAMQDCCIGRGLAALREKEGSISFLWSQMEYFKQIFDRRNTSGTTFGSITKDDLFDLKLCIPKKEVLENFKKLADPFHNQIINNSLQNQKLSELRDWLLPMLMNGQVTVTSVNEGEEIQPLFTDPFIEQQRKITAKKNAPKQAAIIALSIDAHDKLSRNLYRTKGEKTVEVVEKHLNLVLGRQPKKMAAGPAAFKHLVNVVEPLGKKFNWFTVDESDRKGGKSHKYVKGNNFEPFLTKVVKDFEDVLPELLRVINLFANLKTTHEAEVIATTYSGWNNLIIRNEKLTDEAIVLESRENWHEKKLSIERDDFFNAIQWLKANNLVPKGKGKEVK